jgi:hypothetical protein
MDAVRIERYGTLYHQALDLTLRSGGPSEILPFYDPDMTMNAQGYRGTLRDLHEESFAAVPSGVLLQNNGRTLWSSNTLRSMC